MQTFDTGRPAKHCEETLIPPRRMEARLARWILLTLVCFAAFAIASPAQTYSVRTTFAGTGLSPESTSLVQGFDGNFYGVSSLGGVNSKGAIYKVTPDGVLTIIYSFCAQRRCTDGAGPDSLTLGKDGDFYGATSAGGTVNENHGGDGTVFKITPAGVLTTLTNLCGAACGTGFSPNELVQATNGSFYGTTVNGGTQNAGTAFKMTPQGVAATLYNFCSKSNCADGRDPEFALVQASNGSFYGFTGGGDTSHPTLFKMLPTGKLTTLHTFCVDLSTCLDGDLPSGPLVEGHHSLVPQSIKRQTVGDIHRDRGP